MATELINLGTLLEDLGNLMSRPNQFDQAVRTLRNELEVVNKKTEKSKISIKKKHCVRELSGLIENVLDVCNLEASERICNIVRAHGYMIRTLYRSENMNMIKAMLIHILETERLNSVRISFSATARKALDEHLRFVSDLNHGLADGGGDEEAKALLLAGGEARVTAVALFGVARIGKSSLAARMYHGEAKQFEIRVWVTVIREDNILWLTTMKNSEDEVRVEAVRSEEFVSKVTQFIIGRRYLLVLDGVRDVKLWGDVRNDLSDDGNKSRVIITTRNASVAALCGYIHRVKPLSEEASWELFCSAAFGEDRRFLEEVMEASAKIMEVCKGLPVAITALGGYILTRAERPSEWRRLLENISYEENPCIAASLNTIELDFDDLPPHLKVFLMYFSIVPNESTISNERLFRLWIAEGLLQEHQGKTLEEIAEDCLNELVDMNLVKVCESLYEIDKYCRVHNLLHEMVRRVAISNNFCMVCDKEISSLGGKCRRLIISSNEDVQMALNDIEEFRYVRSVFLWNTGHMNDGVLVGFFQKFYFLTMLDIENSPLEILPKEVGDLWCLTYLSLKNTRVRKLPSTISMLDRLELLHISGSPSIELPTEIVKLTRLRHLQVSHDNDMNGLSINSTLGVKLKKGIGRLTNLHTLETMEASLSGKDVIRELKKLKQLRSLRVSRLTTSLAKALFAGIKEMRHLKSLNLHAMRNETLDLKTILFPPTKLECFVMKGKIRNLPNWIRQLDSLRMMCLTHSTLTDDPVNHFYFLPNLESLWLYGAYQGPRLTFEAGFKKLKLLVLREMWELEAIEIAENTMPFLEELRIGPSPLLAEVPVGVARLSRLKILSFYDMPDDFVLRLQQKNSSEFRKVQHVPSVMFLYKFGSGKNYFSYHLGEPELLRHLNDGGFDINTDNVRRLDSRRSFSYSDDEGVSRLSSFKSGQISFFSDDIED